MNFQAVHQANGGYVKMMAQVIDAGPAVQGKYGLEAPILVSDTMGVQQTVICGTGKYNAPIPTKEAHGQTSEFSIKATTTQHGLKYYGFWAIQQQQQAPPPQQLPQAPPQTAQGTNAPPTADDRPLREKCFWEALVTLRAGKLKSEQDVYCEATDYYNWIMFSRTPAQTFAKEQNLGNDPNY